MKWILVLLQFSATGPIQTWQPIEMVDGHCADFMPKGVKEGFCFTVRNGELVVEQPK